MTITDSARRRGRLARALAVTVTAAAVLAGTQTTAAADPVRTPSLDEIFTEYTLGTFQHGRFATPEEISEVILPDDPWYDAPTLTGDERTGQLLKSEKVDVMFAGFKPGDLDAYRVMYVTEDVDGNQTISTGIMMIPVDGRDNADRKIISYQMANDSVGGYCHPSNMWMGRNPIDGSSWSALGPLALMFDRGHAVVISDVGNGGDMAPHTVFAGTFGGQAQLDMIRAAMQVEEAGLSEQAPIGLFGIAGGGVGAARAAEMHNVYAPELDVRSAVLEGMVVDQKSFMNITDGSIGSGFGLANILGLEPSYPDMRIDDHLTPAGKVIADWYRTQCQTPAYFTLPFVPLNLLFEGGQAPADIPAFQRAFDDNRLGTKLEGEQMAGTDVLITSCKADDSFMSLVAAQDSRDLAATYEEHGADVTYAGSDCSMVNMITNLYGWGTDLFGMQTIDWLDASLD